MVNSTSVPERLLIKVAKGSDRLAILCRECRRASEEQEIAKAERELATSFLLKVYGMGRSKELGVTSKEVNALEAVAGGHDYRE